MSTHSPLPKAKIIAAKPSLDVYSILEKEASANTPPKNKTTDAQTENTLSLADIYEKSTSFQPHESETLLYEHEVKQNLEAEEILRKEINEKSKQKTKIKTEEKNDSEDDHEITSDHLSEIANSKKTIEKTLAELEKKKERLEKDQDDNNIGVLVDEIAVLKEALNDIDILQKKLSPSSNNKNPNKTNHISDGTESEKENAESGGNKESELSPKSKSDLERLIIKRTTTKHRSSAGHAANPVRSFSPSNNKQNNDTSENLRDDIHQFTNIEDRNRIEKIDNKILKHSKFATQLGKKIAKCKSEIEKLDESSQSSDDEFPTHKSIKISEKKKILKTLENQYTQRVCELGRLFAERDNVGRPFLSPPTKELPDTEHITQGISENTKKLEENYKKLLKEYTEKINNDPVAEVTAARWNLAAGAAAFGTSFFITNTASRLLPLWVPIPPWVSLIITPIIAGTLHTVVATPTAKQIMLRTWRSPVLAEMNNYFRLLGAYWHDKRNDKLDEKKYVSKDPANEDLMTIGERIEEEREFSSIFYDRYHSEENPYFSYTAFYSLKGIFQSMAFNAINPSTEAATYTDALTHAISGFISGAIYLHVQQSRRSERPGNTVDVSPTHEIHQAQAEWLTSRRDDLKKMITELEAVDKGDPRLRELSIKLHKTEVALVTAVAKSGKLTAWLHDFKAQFKPEVLADTLADMAGRILSLYPTAVVSHFCTGLRASANPFLVMLSYVLPAASLIAVPGFQARGVYGGLIRACIQSMVGAGSAPNKTERKYSVPDDENNSEVITLSDSDYETDSDEEKDNPTWAGRPLKRDEEMV